MFKEGLVQAAVDPVVEILELVAAAAVAAALAALPIGPC
jgi:hypothetical protein